MRRSELLERERPKRGAYVVTLRTLLRLTNTLLALLGLAMLGYAVYTYVKWKGAEFPSPAVSPATSPAGLQGHLAAPAPAHPLLQRNGILGDDPSPPPPEPAPPAPAPHHRLKFPWFIFAFGAAGGFTFLTAGAGLAGVAWNSRALLGLYSVLLVVMLLAQAAVAVALFADSSWRKYLPPDETGEFKKIERFVRSKLEVCRWVGLAVLLVQLASLALAYMLSAAQQKALEVSDDEDEEVWGRRVPLLSSDAAGSASASERGEAGAGARRDAWSTRMRDKYGLDTSQFSYNPEGREAAAGQLPHAEEQQQRGPQRRCAVM